MISRRAAAGGRDGRGSSYVPIGDPKRQGRPAAPPGHCCTRRRLVVGAIAVFVAGGLCALSVLVSAIMKPGTREHSWWMQVRAMGCSLEDPGCFDRDRPGCADLVAWRAVDGEAAMPPLRVFIYDGKGGDKHPWPTPPENSPFYARFLAELRNMSAHPGPGGACPVPAPARGAARPQRGHAGRGPAGSGACAVGPAGPVFGSLSADARDSVLAGALRDAGAEATRVHVEVVSSAAEACLLVPGFDVSCAFGHVWPAPIEALRQTPEWQDPHGRGDGRNHLLIEVADGHRTRPWTGRLRREGVAAFDTDFALVAKRGASALTLRRGMDTALPLTPLQRDAGNKLVVARTSGDYSCGEAATAGGSGRRGEGEGEGEGVRVGRDKYLATFKGSWRPDLAPVRERLAALLHDGREVIVAGRPAADTQAHGWGAVAYDFEDLRRNSTFGLAPEGGGLDSYRMYEALEVGAVPVLVSGNDDLLGAFDHDHGIDWDALSVSIPHGELAGATARLRAIAHDSRRLQRLREAGRAALRSVLCDHTRLFRYMMRIVRARIAELEPL